MSDKKFTNRLANETSPYLLQHAHNPVDWYPWGPEALAKAKNENKPIFLSIGYSACHWCHVMEKESFEDPATAAVMNEHFVNIKVDREERPDLDQIYMNAVQLMTQHGGWPMSVWLTPELKPFYGGTYFPPQRRYGMSSFRDVLAGVADAYKNRRDEVESASNGLVGHLDRLGEIDSEEGPLGPELIESACEQLVRAIDIQYGGIGRAPKFPHSGEMRLLFRAWRISGRDEFKKLALFSLEQMIRGGIYDQLGGGYHRYSTDQKWLAPHFEKMLYDNSLITLANIEAYQITGADVFKNAVLETLDYVLREMTSPAGGFYSTQDADSEGEEGKFFVWTLAEIQQILGDDAKAFAHCYDVSEGGNWEHKNILNLPKPIDQCAAELRLEPDELRGRLAAARSKLFAVRSHRIAPGRDEKILAAWNGMMIDAMATAASVLDIDRYRTAAANAADFVLKTMRTPNGLLLRTAKDGKAKLNGYLEDYSYLANSLVSLYEATFESRWLTSAGEVVNVMIEQFWDEKKGGFFFTGKDHETLITRSKDPQDGATPSGNSMAATALARLAKLTGRDDLRDKAEVTLKAFRSIMTQSAIASAQMLIALGIHRGPTDQLVLVEGDDPADWNAALRSINRSFLPNKVVAGKRKSPVENTSAQLSILNGKAPIGGQSTLYACRDFTCQQPAAGKAAIEATLEAIFQKQ